MSNAYKQQFGTNLKMKFTNSIEFKLKKGYSKAVDFVKDELALQANVNVKKNKLEVAIQSGVKEQ